MEMPDLPDRIWLEYVGDTSGEFSSADWLDHRDEPLYLRATPERIAAPELLEALKKIATKSDDGHEEYTPQSMVSIARAAIAKATTGGQG